MLGTAQPSHLVTRKTSKAALQPAVGRESLSLATVQGQEDSSALQDGAQGLNGGGASQSELLATYRERLLVLDLDP